MIRIELAVPLTDDDVAYVRRDYLELEAACAGRAESPDGKARLIEAVEVLLASPRSADRAWRQALRRDVDARPAHRRGARALPGAVAIR